MSWHRKIKNKLIEDLSLHEPNEVSQLNNALRLLAKHRSLLIQNTVIQNSGLTVHQGPLTGLVFVKQSSEGCHVAKLIGCYEQPLHSHIRAAIEENYESIINIGCAEGYYAVGMARKLNETRTYAYDISESAQQTCLQLAKENGVTDRVQVGAVFNHHDFQKFSGSRTLLFCDIEGAESELLDPSLAPELKSMDIIVEAHEVERPGIVKLLSSRFEGSHSINLVEDDGHRYLDQMPTWFMNLSHLDQLLAVWEWRSGPTPWLVMKTKAMQ